MNDGQLKDRVRARYQELSARLEEAVRRATETKVQYDELAELLEFASDDEREKIQRLRQSKIAENAHAVEQVNEILAKLKIHEELLNLFAQEPTQQELHEGEPSDTKATKKNKKKEAE